MNTLLDARLVLGWCMLITGEVFVTVAGLSVVIAAHIDRVLSQYSIAVSQDAYFHQYTSGQYTYWPSFIK